MRVIAWDSWAFIEVALGFARGPVVEHLWSEGDLIVTSRDVVAETFNFIAGKSKRNTLAREWLAAARQSRVRIVEASFDEVSTFIESHPEAARLSWTDFSLAFVAEQAGTREVATTDTGFRQLGFDPVFATRT